MTDYRHNNSQGTFVPKSIESFILTLSESQKLYNLRNSKKKHNRKSKYYTVPLKKRALSISIVKKSNTVPRKHGDSQV